MVWVGVVSNIVDGVVGVIVDDVIVVIVFVVVGVGVGWYAALLYPPFSPSLTILVYSNIQRHSL